MKGILRGELAEKTGFSKETLRFYEKCGILPAPKRSDHGYRLYSESTVELLAFIQTAKKAGFTIAEIKRIFSLVIESQSDFGELNDYITMKIKEIACMEKELKTARKNMEEIKYNIEHAVSCPLLGVLLENNIDS